MALEDLSFRNRTEAGRQLATHLMSFRSRNPVVLALPRGGVPVGFEVAKALRAPSISSSCARSAHRATLSWGSARWSTARIRNV